MAKATKKDTGDTSFCFVGITTTVGKLIKLFPNSYFEENTGKDKCNFHFDLETENGDVFTIYDFKKYRPIELDEEIDFHIGSLTVEAAVQGRLEVLEMLSNLK